MTDQTNDKYGYELAYKLACEKLASSEDIEQQCLKSGAVYRVADSQKAITIEYLNQSYQITFPDIEVSLTDSGEGVPLKDKILILHYLTLAKGTPATNRWIAYKELPEGANYFPTFAKRAIKPLLDHFGKEPQQLIDVAKKLGGRKTDYGNVSVTINAFSRIPITLILWQGDDEFAPEGSIIFDSNISDYLSTEDVIVLCEILIWRLVKSLRAVSYTHLTLPTN